MTGCGPPLELLGASIGCKGGELWRAIEALVLTSLFISRVCSLMDLGFLKLELGSSDAFEALERSKKKKQKSKTTLLESEEQIWG